MVLTTHTIDSSTKAASGMWRSITMRA